MFEVDYLIAYNRELGNPLIISTKEPFHVAKVFLFDTYKGYVDFLASNNFLTNKVVDGYKIILAYDGTLGGKVIEIDFDYKKMFEEIMSGMDKFFREERIQKHPKSYEKYLMDWL